MISNNFSNESDENQELRWILIDMALGILTFLVPAISDSKDYMSRYTVSEMVFGYIALIIFGAIYGYLIYYLPASYFQRKSNEKQQNEDRIRVMQNADKILKAYFQKKDYEAISKKMTLSKRIALPGGVDFIVDTKNKVFSFYNKRSKNYGFEFDKLLNNKSLTLNDIRNVSSSYVPPILEDFYTSYSPQIYNFNDLNKVELIDKTTTDEKRTYIMESKSGDALMGAFIGEMFSETVFDNYGTIGAIVGASGERKITENVDKKTNFAVCVNVYLNDINESYKSFTFTSESAVREFVGILEYIKNNS